jgi:hypothetical protein
MRNEAPPTVKQIWAIAATLCKQAGEEFPRDRGAASALLDKLKGGTREGRESTEAGDSKVLA